MRKNSQINQIGGFMNRKALALGIVGLLTYSVPTMPVKATNNKSIQLSSSEDQTRTVGLIYRYEVAVSGKEKKIYINGTTASNNSMKSIGYKDISIEYSSDGVNWYREMHTFDLLKSYSSSYYLNNYAVSVKGGYYYRVSLTHYAKESGWFGSSQSVENTSNSVWID